MTEIMKVVVYGPENFMLSKLPEETFMEKIH